MKSGFTLIELLVVVLIIGILSAVALPQYERTVFKSRTAQAWTVVGSLLPAVEEYCLAQDPTQQVDIDDLSITMADTDDFYFFTMRPGDGYSCTCSQFQDGTGEIVAGYRRDSHYNIFAINRNGRRRCGGNDEESKKRCFQLGFKNEGTACFSGVHTCYTE